MLAKRHAPDADLAALDAELRRRFVKEGMVAVMTASKICDGAVVTGWGIHQGEVLLVPHTDVQLGDPVNTASKIGQDLAELGEKVISQEVYQALPSSLRSEYHFTERTLEASGVQQRVWRV